ncbi:hypothetical protein RCH09_003786, partial [Actimicrobium sp. GrIS 1.19]|nr:hypothetical protein [Actimicrobium sp. GrIS 1.19]
GETDLARRRWLHLGGSVDGYLAITVMLRNKLAGIDE